MSNGKVAVETKPCGIFKSERSRMISYGFIKELNVPFEQARTLVTDALKQQGLGILTEIDVKEKFKEKLGIDFKKYVILGACNPANAHKAILAEENIGLLLPCNVILYEKDAKTVVSVIRPTIAMQTAENEKLREIAETVEASLRTALDSLEKED